jgi:hypothetical protein
MEYSSPIVTRATRFYEKRHETGTPVLLKRIYQYSSCIDHTVSHFNVKVTGNGGFTGVVMVLLIDDDDVTIVSRFQSLHVGFF